METLSLATLIVKECEGGGLAGGGWVRLGFVVGWGKWLDLVWVGRENGFVWYFLDCAGRGLGGRELHAGLIVERGNGVVGGRAFVFNEKWGNVEVTGGDASIGCTNWK